MEGLAIAFPITVRYMTCQIHERATTQVAAVQGTRQNREMRVITNENVERLHTGILFQSIQYHRQSRFSMWRRKSDDGCRLRISVTLQLMKLVAAQKRYFNPPSDLVAPSTRNAKPWLVPVLST